jgi:hypothetical protein
VRQRDVHAIARLLGSRAVAARRAGIGDRCGAVGRGSRAPVGDVVGGGLRPWAAAGKGEAQDGALHGAECLNSGPVLYGSE